ncbi:hypothetical protein ScPMuIL_017450 [Solemya velum]
MEALSEELRSLREQQGICLKQQDKILGRISAMQSALPKQRQDPRFTKNVEASEFETYKIKVNQLEKQVKEKSREIRRLQKTSDEFQDSIFRSFVHVTQQIHSDLGYLEETCRNLGHTVQNVKEDFDRMWLSTPLKVRTFERRVKQQFEETGKQLPSADVSIQTKTNTNSQESRRKPLVTDVNKYRENAPPKQAYFSLTYLENKKEKETHQDVEVHSQIRPMSEQHLRKCVFPVLKQDTSNLDLDMPKQIPVPAAAESQPHSQSDNSDDDCQDTVNNFDSYSTCSSSDSDHVECYDTMTDQATADTEQTASVTQVTQGNELIPLARPHTSSLVDETLGLPIPPTQMTDDAFKLMHDMMRSGTSEISLGSLQHGFSGIKASKAWMECVHLLLASDIPLSDSNISKLLEAMSDAGEVSSQTSGLDTMIVLDISGSMAGPPLTEMKQTVFNFLNGLTHLENSLSIRENVGLITIGHETKLYRHFTHNHLEIRNCVDSLTAGGKTPLMMGLLLAVCEIETHGKRIHSKDGSHVICPRIILITDGRVNTQHECEGQDDFEEFDGDSNQIKLQEPIFNLAVKLQESGYPIHALGVGNCRKEFLVALSESTGGHLYEKHELEKLYRYHQFQHLAGHILFLPSEQAKAIIRAVEPNLNEQQMEEVIALAKKSVDSNKFNTGNIREGQEDDDGQLPCIGTRVRRGPDWKGKDEDSEGVGTVTGHYCGKLSVRWDNDYLGCYSHGNGGQYEVWCVEEPRVLTQGQLIEVGVHVRRGPDWVYGDQDGFPGSIGVVFRKRKEGQVNVRWPHGYKDVYNYGNRGEFHLEIVNVGETDERPETRTGTDIPLENTSTVTQYVQSENDCTASAAGHSEVENGAYNISVNQERSEVVWQWQDDRQQWRMHTPHTINLIEREFQNNPQGSALVAITKNGMSVDVKIIFERMIQKETSGDDVHRVRRFMCTLADFHRYLRMEIRR